VESKCRKAKVDCLTGYCAKKWDSQIFDYLTGYCAKFYKGVKENINW
jgi:hypothetical protein